MKATHSTFLGLEITMTSRCFEVKNSTDLLEALLNLYGLENSKPSANPGRRSTVIELATAITLDGQDYSNFRTAVGKLIFMATWRPDMQFAIHQLSTQVLNPTTENKRAVKQLTRYPKGKHNACLRLEPHIHDGSKKVYVNSLVPVTRIGLEFRQRAKALRDIIAMYKDRRCATEV